MNSQSSDSRSETTSSQSRGAFSSIGGKADESRINYNTPPIQVGNEVRDGDEFVLITRSKQSDGFHMWSSGDKDVTEQLYRQAATQVLGLQPETATT